MVERIEKHGLQVDRKLADFIEGHAIVGTGVDVDAFWAGLSGIVHDLGPRNRALLEMREDIQEQIDQWHKANRGADAATYQAFLREIGIWCRQVLILQ